MRIVRSIEKIDLGELQKKLSKYELAHLAFFFANKKAVEDFVQTISENKGVCLTCLNALKKLGVIVDE